MPFLLHAPVLPAHGLLYRDKEEALRRIERECLKQITKTITLEQEAYLSQHPEIKAMLALIFAKVISKHDRPSRHVNFMAEYFTRPSADLDLDIRKVLNLTSNKPYTTSEKIFEYENKHLLDDLLMILRQPLPFDVSYKESSVNPTKSSSLMSVITSATTLPTPAPTPPRELTLAEILHDAILSAVDNAIHERLQEYQIYYDTAYVAFMEAVETAMEIPVQKVRTDIATLCAEAWYQFESIIEEKERLTSEIAWKYRLRKKIKKLLRREKKFKDLQCFLLTCYETPPTEATEKGLSQANYGIPPVPPFTYHPQWKFNRYPKDHFGVYLPQELQFSDKNITITPGASQDNISEFMVEMYGSGSDSLHEEVHKEDLLQLTRSGELLTQYRDSKEVFVNKPLKKGSKENVKPQNV